MQGHVEDRLLDYLYEELDDAARGAVEAHLETCARCQEAYAGLAGTRRLMTALPEETPERGLDFVLQAAAREQRLRRDRPVGALARLGAWITAHPVSTSVAVAGAAVLVVVGVGESRLLHVDVPAPAPARVQAPAQAQAQAQAEAPVAAKAQAPDGRRSLKRFDVPAATGSAGAEPAPKDSLAKGIVAGGAPPAIGGLGTVPRGPDADQDLAAPPAKAARLRQPAHRHRRTRAPGPAPAAMKKAAEANAVLLDEEARNLKRGHGRGRTPAPDTGRLATIQVVRGKQKREAAPAREQTEARRAKAHAASRLAVDKDAAARPSPGTGGAAPEGSGLVGGIVGGLGAGPGASPAAAPPPPPVTAEAAPAATELVPRAPRAHRTAEAPPQPRALSLAIDYLDRGLPRRALPLLTQVLQGPSADWTGQAYYARCRAFAALGDKGRARDDCRQAIRHGGPDTTRAQHLLLVLEAGR